MEERAYLGCLQPKVDVRDYKLCSANADIVYPKQYILDNLPKVKDQKTVNSCCAHATSSILEYHAKNKYDLSTNFIYGIQKSFCGHAGQGMYLVDALKISKNYGDMLEGDCPGNTEVPECWAVADSSLNSLNKRNEAYKFRISSYYLCNTDNDIKYALMNYGPVLAGIMWREAYVLDMDGVITFDLHAQAGGHAIMIVGWTEKGWVIQNSWGTNFGLDGRFILPFEYGFFEARAIIDVDNDSEFTSTVLIKPLRGPLIDIIYKITNWFLNLFRS